MGSDATRFTFRLDSVVEQLLIQDPDALVGTEVPVRWDDQEATGRIERVDRSEDGIRVTMAIDRPLDLISLSLPLRAGGSKKR
jgi:hypothetical protein